MNAHERLKRLIAERVVIRSKETGPRIVRATKSESKEMRWLFDFRAIMLSPEFLEAYTEVFWQRYERDLPFQVAGLETAGIPLVTAIVMKGIERGTPVNGFFLRKSRKREGLMKIIEGTCTDERVILVDDLINSGSTFNRQALVLADAGKPISDAFALVRFRAPAAYEELVQAGIRLHTIFSLDEFGCDLLSPDAPEVPKDSFETLWRVSYGKPSFEHVVAKSAPAIDDARIYIGSDDGIFSAFAQETGERLWSYEIGSHPQGKGIFSSPALHADHVYFGAYDGSVHALDAKTGAALWKFSEADWIGSSPSLAPDLGLLFIGLEFGLVGQRGGIAAVKLSTGERVWCARTPALTHGSPLYIRAERMVVIGSNDGVVYAYEATTGKELWHLATRGDVKYRPAYDEKRRLVLVTSFDGTVYAVRAQDGILAFVLPMAGPSYATCCIHDDTAYVASLDKHVYAIDLETGKERWAFQTRGRIFASPIMAEGSLWIGSNDGCLYELDPDRGALRSFFQTSERIVNAVCYNRKTRRFFVPTVSNELYCIRRKSPNKT